MEFSNLEIVDVSNDVDLKKFILYTLKYFTKVGYYKVKRGEPLGGFNFKYFICRDVEKKIPITLIITCMGNPLVLRKAGIDIDVRKSVFLRRIFTLPPFNNLQLSSKCLNLLEEKLKNEGIEIIYSFTLPKHSGALYKHAGWNEGYKVKRKRIKMFYKILK